MKRKYYILLLICSLLPFTLHAQVKFSKPSPQTAELMRHGQMPVSLYTGQVSPEIPLYHLQDKDFDIPLVLKYAYDGLKPTQRHGSTGQGWSLSGLGAITREIYGAPDDCSAWHSPIQGNGDVLTHSATKGFWQAVNKRPYNADDLFNFQVQTSSETGYNLPFVSNCFYDCIPDLFMFTMPGHSGRFMIDNQGGVITTPKNYKVDLSGMNAQSDNIDIEESKIVITAPDGYIYTFGYSDNNSQLKNTYSLEHSISHRRNDYFPNGVNDPILAKRHINAWHLTRIQSPNGRILTFNYANNNTNDYLMANWTLVNNTAQEENRYSYQSTRIALLESIEVEDTGLKIEFSYSEEGCEPFYGNFMNCGPTFQLDNLVVKQDNATLYTFSLSYEVKSHLRFLKSVTHPDGGIYTLAYEHPSNYPSATTDDVDSYDYWTDSNGTAYGLLKSITYPTGGCTKFEYEQQDYNQRVQRSFSLNNVGGVSYDCSLLNESGTLNSYRIQRIRHFETANATNPLMSKRYYYYSLKDWERSNTLLRSPVRIYNDTIWTEASTDNWKNNYALSEPIVGYGKVTEISLDTTFVEYEFSDYTNEPDLYDNTSSGVINYKWTKDATIDNTYDLIFNHSSLSITRWDRRGQLNKKRVFDASRNLKEITNYTYRYIPLNLMPIDMLNMPQNNPYVVAFFPIYKGGMTMKLQLLEYPLLREETTEYFNDGTNYKTEKFYYRNADEQVATYKELTSTGDTLKTVYTYPKQLSVVGNKYYGLVYSNMVNKPVEEIYYLNSTKTGKKRIIPKDLINCGTVVDSIVTSKGSYSEKLEVHYAVYDFKGNPIHIIYGDGTEEVIVWGYKGRYPVAQIQGANYDEVLDALNIAPDLLSMRTTPDMDLLNSLRTSLPHALVTTYTYQPEVGLTSITDADGRTTSYEYNNKGELTTERNHEGEVVKRYAKHYRTN